MENIPFFKYLIYDSIIFISIYKWSNYYYNFYDRLSRVCLLVVICYCIIVGNGKILFYQRYILNGTQTDNFFADCISISGYHLHQRIQQTKRWKQLKNKAKRRAETYGGTNS